MANTNLSAIRQKVRRLTRTPSESQLTNAELDNYINTAILYEMPEQLRLFSLRTVLTFYTQPFVDTYQTNTTDVNDPLYDFQNKYIAVHPPVYMAGVQSFFTQDRDVFYGYYPQTNTTAMTGLVGDGSSGPFTGTLTAKPVLQNNVVISCLDTSGASMILIDYPINNQIGALGLPNEPQVLPSPYGEINYVTGAFTANFAGNTQVSTPIMSNTIAYQPGKPLSMLYFDNKFTIRPVPDKTYVIQIEADISPVELLSSTQDMKIKQWWQYIAYLASKLIFQDRMDIDSVNLIMPELKNQEVLVLRTTLTQQANQRTVTIYTQGKYMGSGWFGGGWPY